MEYLLPYVLSTSVAQAKINMDINMRATLIAYAKRSSEGWAAGNDAIAGWMRLLSDPSHKVYSSFGHEMLDGERDALRRNFHPPIEYSWA